MEMSIKVCNKCDIGKEENSINFEFRNDIQNYRGACKECISKQKSLYRTKKYKNNPSL